LEVVHRDSSSSSALIHLLPPGLSFPSSVARSPCRTERPGPRRPPGHSRWPGRSCRTRSESVPIHRPIVTSSWPVTHHRREQCSHSAGLAISKRVLDEKVAAVKGCRPSQQDRDIPLSDLPSEPVQPCHHCLWSLQRRPRSRLHHMICEVRYCITLVTESDTAVCIASVARSTDVRIAEESLARISSANRFIWVRISASLESLSTSR
jgi:hypothetical protein